MLTKTFSAVATRAVRRAPTRALTTASPTSWSAPTVDTVRDSLPAPTLDALVCKFGGSSVGNAEAVQRVAKLLQSYNEVGTRTVGVLSAFYGVTDRLLEIAKAAEKGDHKEMKRVYDNLLHWHEGVIGDLFPHNATEITGQHEHLHKVMDFAVWRTAEAAAEAGGLNALQSDKLVTAGERISNHVMSGSLRQLGVASEYVPADTLLVTDGVHGNASPNLRASRIQVQNRLYPLLGRGVVPCVTGFFGSHPDGQSVCTFGRGGSDLTASTLANCLSAQPGRAAVIIWKVECNKAEDGTMASWEDGFTGVVHDAAVDVTIPRLSYREAAQLVAFGKKVLHPETMEPAEARSIPVIVKNTLRPELPGTRICADGSSSGEPAPDAPQLQGVTSITKATVEMATSKVAGLSLDESALTENLRGASPGDASFVVLVGEGVSNRAEVRNTALKALAEEQIPAYVPPRVNGSEHNLCIAVPTEQVKSALHALHKGAPTEARA